VYKNIGKEKYAFYTARKLPIDLYIFFGYQQNQDEETSLPQFTPPFCGARFKGMALGIILKKVCWRNKPEV
jgi:hypothetical protein